MVHENETIVIKSSSVKLAEWVKRLKQGLWHFLLEV
jgi:hypothetical protein